MLTGNRCHPDWSPGGGGGKLKLQTSSTVSLRFDKTRFSIKTLKDLLELFILCHMFLPLVLHLFPFPRSPPFNIVVFLGPAMATARREIWEERPRISNRRRPMLSQEPKRNRFAAATLSCRHVCAVIDFKGSRVSKSRSIFRYPTSCVEFDIKQWNLHSHLLEAGKQGHYGFHPYFPREG